MRIDGHILPVFLRLMIVVSGAMIGYYLVTNQGSFIASLNLVLTLFDFFGALILLQTDR
jgi:hypothetical protein